MNKQSVAIHITANHHLHFVQYAAVCIHSLVNKGRVDPRDIFVSVGDKFKDTLEFNAIADQGVTVMVEPMGDILGKFVQIDEFFDMDPGYQWVLKLDADTILMENCHFTHEVMCLIGGNHMGCYRQYNQKPLAVQQNRLKCLGLPGFKQDTRNGQKRFVAVARGLFNIDMLSYSNWLAAQPAWWYGGFIVVSRDIITKPVWRSLVAMQAITPCDETCIAMAEYNNRPHNHLSFLMGEFHQDDFPHTVNPENLSSYLKSADLPAIAGESPRGMLHTAGQWYRHEKEENRKVLRGLFNRVTRQLQLT